MPGINNFYYSLSKTKLRNPLTWYRHLQIQQSDTMLASYPRSGNTWLRFLLFELLAGYPASFETINRADSAVPELRNLRHAPTSLDGNGRLIKTHEPFRKEYQRAIYLVRDPRDVAISEYYFLKYKGIEFLSFDHYLTHFLKGKVNGFGNWLHHVNSWLTAKQKNEARILVIKYEEIQGSTQQTLFQILDFLNLFPNPNAIQAAIQNNTIQKMRQKEETARQTIFKQYPKEINFVRKGLVRGWENTLTSLQAQRIEDATQNILHSLEYL